MAEMSHGEWGHCESVASKTRQVEGRIQLEGGFSAVSLSIFSSLSQVWKL